MQNTKHFCMLNVQNLSPLFFECSAKSYYNMKRFYTYVKVKFLNYKKVSTTKPPCLSSLRSDDKMLL